MNDGDRGRIDAQPPETNEAATSPLFDMEPVIGDMESFIRIIGHLVSSDNEVGPDEWLAVESRLLVLHRELDRLWNAAFDEQSRERTAHEAELEAVKKSRAVPGSPADLEHVGGLWRMLTAVAQMIQERARDAEGARLLGGDAGLPPAESEGRAPA